MATSAVLFKNSTPQSMQNNKLYNDDNKFSPDDLQDVLDGLLKLGVSDNNTTKHPLPRRSPSPTKTKNISDDDSHSNPNQESPNRHHPPYQQEPSFIASSRSTLEKSNKTMLFGINLLFEAAKKVEGVSHFKMDVADINRVTRKIDDIDNDLTYNVHTGILKKKSKNGISPPIINTIDELMDDPDQSALAFADLTDDFTPIHDKIRSKLRFSDISSIGRRSSMYNNVSLLSPMANHKLSIDQQQEENKRLSREWSTRNIQEMDKIYADKTKLKQSQISESKLQAHSDRHSPLAAASNIVSGAVGICSEFSQSNMALTEVVNKHLDNVNAVHEDTKTRIQARQRQNNILLQQLQTMEHKITVQKAKEIAIEKARKHNMNAEKLKKQQMAADAVAAAAAEQKRQDLAKQTQINAVNAAAAAAASAVAVEAKQNVIDEKQQWYPYEEELAKVSKHYKAVYKQYDSLVTSFEANGGNFQSDLEMAIGLIVRSISSNQKSVFEAYKRFQKLVDNKSQKGSNERQYCFIEITKLIICDVRIVKSSAQKFASSYFLSFIMNEYKDEYLEVFKCMFFHYCIWTIPYIDKQLRDLKIKQAAFDNNRPSIVRCVCLGYLPIKNIGMVPKDKRVYLQEFIKTNDAGKVIFESENKYFTRSQHICGLFAAFMSIRNEKQFINPFGIDSQHCWKWIVYLLGLPQCVYPELCSILSGIIQIIGHDMLEKYPKQFPKMVRYIYENIYQQCKQDTTTRAKAKRELNLFLRECQQCMQQNNGKLIIKKPKESKLIAQTVGATALTNIRR